MQQLNPSEISEIIKQRIDQLDVSSEARNEGTVVSVTDGIIRIHGLAEVMYGEMIEFEGGVYGMALNLERDSVGAVILGDYKGLAEGQTCRCTGRILEVPVGPELQGRVVDALGIPIDGKGPIEASASSPIECSGNSFFTSNLFPEPMQVPVDTRAEGEWWANVSRIHHVDATDADQLAQAEADTTTISTSTSSSLPPEVTTTSDSTSTTEPTRRFRSRSRPKWDPFKKASGTSTSTCPPITS